MAMTPTNPYNIGGYNPTAGGGKSQGGVRPLNPYAVGKVDSGLGWGQFGPMDPNANAAMGGPSSTGPGVPSGYTNPTGANGYPAGYDASNTDPATLSAYGYGTGGMNPSPTNGGAPSVANPYLTGAPVGGPNQQPFYGTGPGQMGPAQDMNGAGTVEPPAPESMGQYGYGNRAGQGGGYYEQQTPVGSFAAANQQRTGSQQYADNRFIGQASKMNLGDNKYLGGSAGQADAASNPYAGMNNPYTTEAIDNASNDAIRNYQKFTAPARDAQAVRSGSFGNSGVQEMQLEDQRNLQGTLGGIATNARMADLAAQQRMGESAADRQTSNSQFNTGTRAGDLNRNLVGTYTGQGVKLQGLGLDANLEQGQSIFNAGQGNAMDIFNTGQGNALNMFNAGQGNSMLENYRTRNQQGGQFDQNMDFNTWKANNDNMRNGSRDQMDFIKQLTDLQGQGVNTANTQQQQPITDWATFSRIAAGMGGLGNITEEQFKADPVLGAIAGYLASKKP